MSFRMHIYWKFIDGDFNLFMTQYDGVFWLILETLFQHIRFTLKNIATGARRKNLCMFL